MTTKNIIVNIRTQMEGKGSFDNVLKPLRPLVKKFDDLGKMMPKIRYQWLSIMFLGWQLQRVFGGMIKPVAETVGAFEPLKLAIEDMLTPFLIPFTDKMWELFDVFDKLPEPVKSVGGGIILIGYGAGTILANLGQLALSLGALFALFTYLGISIGGISIAFNNFLIGLLMLMIPIAALILILKGLDLVVTKLFGVTLAEGVRLGVEKAIGWLKYFWGGLLIGIKRFGDFFKRIKDGFAKFVADIRAWVIYLVDEIKRWFKKLEDIPIIGGIIGFGKKVASGVSNIFGKIFGGRQAGGYIPQTGLYNLHAGEYVQSSGNNITFAPTITINASLSQPMDIRRIADELEGYWANKMGVNIWQT